MSFAMSMRTRTDSEAYSVFITNFATLVAVSCVGNFVSLGVAYISKLGVGQALVRILESAVVRLKPAIVRCWHVCTEKCRAGAAGNGGNDEVIGPAGDSLFEMAEMGDIRHGMTNPFYDVDEMAFPFTEVVFKHRTCPETGRVDVLEHRTCPETGRVDVFEHRTCPETGRVDVFEYLKWFEHRKCPETGRVDVFELRKCPETGRVDEFEHRTCPETGRVDVLEHRKCPVTGCVTVVAHL